jgi:S1-C subfamily serine protease
MVAEELDPNAFAFAYDDSSFVSGLPRKVSGAFPEMIDLTRLSGRWLEVELVSVDKDLGEYFGTTEGVLVVRAPRDTSLHLRSGDVILAIDGRKASNPAQAMRILRSYETGESFDIQIMRQKRRTTVTARIPTRDRGFFYQNY